MSEFVIREAISANLAANQKEAAIREMVENLRLAGYFKGNEAEDVVKAILKRELLSSTGIGDGVAIPHAKHPSVERLVGAVAVSQKGVPFDSVDNDPVFVLVIAGLAAGAPQRTPARPRRRITLSEGQELRPVLAASDLAAADMGPDLQPRSRCVNNCQLSAISSQPETAECAWVWLKADG